MHCLRSRFTFQRTDNSFCRQVLKILCRFLEDRIQLGLLIMTYGVFLNVDNKLATFFTSDIAIAFTVCILHLPFS